MHGLLRIMIFAAGYSAFSAVAAEPMHDAVGHTVVRTATFANAGNVADGMRRTSLAVAAPASSYSRQASSRTMTAAATDHTDTPAGPKPSTWGTAVLGLGLVVHQLLRRARRRSPWDLG